MNVLAFDTATPATAVALVATADTAADPFARELRHDPAPGERPGHAMQLLPLATELLEAAGMTFDDLDRIAVGVGPGTFTGLRIGVATARALAQASGAELVGGSTLRTLAANAGDRPVLAVLDARRGEAFVAEYDERGEEVRPPAAVTPQTLSDLARPSLLGIGDGSVRFREVLEPAGMEIPEDGSPLHQVSALALARLATEVHVTGESVTPDYLRLPDAEIARRRRERSQSPP